MKLLQQSNILSKFMLLAGLALLSGCAVDKASEESDIKTGGMTSGGWGTLTSETFAICSVDISEEASSDDRQLTVAVIHEDGLGAALWYDLLLGDQHHQLENVRLDQPFHRFGFPLMLDGRSIPLTRGAPDSSEAAGALTLTATNDDDFVGVASWKRAGRTAKTVANLSCKRSHRIDGSLLSVTTCVEDTLHAAPTSNPLKFYLSGFGSGLRTIRVTRKDSSGSDVNLGVFNGASISSAGAKSALVTYMQDQERIQLDIYPDATAPGNILGIAMFNSPRIGNGNQHVRCQ